MFSVFPLYVQPVMVYSKFVRDLSCWDFSSKILHETERPTDVGKIHHSDKNYTLHTSPKEKNAYRGT